MYQQLDDMQTTVEGIDSIPIFGYVETALETDTGIPGHNEFSDLNANNIPLVDGTGLTLQEIEKGFRDNISTLSRAFFTHFFGRSSYNINKLRMLFSDVLGTCKADYTHNFRAWDSTAVYQENDVCFLVAYGIRYCFKSLVDDNTETIEANADGTLEYDDTAWVLLNEVRTVKHPIGKPFLWFGGDLPGEYLCFSDGARYEWASYPALDTSEFRALLTRFTWKGAKADSQSFTVPVIKELYPMSVEDIPDALSTIAAKVPAHCHNLNDTGNTVSTNSTLNMNHYHSMNSTNDAGGHTHYTGDYCSRSFGSVDADSGYHEDSEFKGSYYKRSGDKEQGYDEVYIGVDITPSLANAEHGNHAVTMNTETHSHTHSGVVVPSGAGDYGPVEGKYRPGTVKTILAVRAV